MLFNSSFEWEYLNSSKKFNFKNGIFKLIVDTKFPEIISLVISRNEQYKIEVDITGYYSSYNDFKKLEDIVKSNKTFKFEIITKKFKLNILAYSELNSTYHFNNSEYKMKLFAKKIYKQKDIEDINQKCYFIKEWYINAPILNTLNYQKITEYKKTNHFSKCRLVKKGYKENLNKLSCSNEISFESNDLLIIKPENFPSFFIQKVIDIYGPKWSNCLEIEYQKSLGLPNNKQRKKISDLVSFILGKNLIKIGETFYNFEGNPILEISLESYEMNYLNLESLCVKKEKSPILLLDSCKQFSIENDLSFLISKYLSWGDDINMSKTFNYALKSLFQPLNVEFDYINLAFNSLSDFYFKNFEGLVDDIGLMDKSIQFLSRIDLSIGKAEKDALEYINNIDENNVKQLLKFSKRVEAYRVLLNRSILKVLNYNGNYFDWCSGENCRNINQPIPDEYYEEINEEIEKMCKN